MASGLPPPPKPNITLTPTQLALNGTHSALFGSPPETQEDYQIVQGSLILTKVIIPNLDLDPHYGFPFFASAPPGYVYNDRQRPFLIGMAFALFIMLTFTSARIALRLSVHRLTWGADDWAILFGTFLAIAVPILGILMVVYGGHGKHIWDVTYHEFNTYGAMSVAMITIFFVSLGVIKISITLLLRRVAGGISKQWRLASDIFVGLLVLYTIAAAFGTTILCDPPIAAYDVGYVGRLGRPAKCIPNSNVQKGFSVVHVVMDFCLLLAPVIIFWKLQMSRGKKIRLCLLFSVCVVSCIFSILRDHAGLASVATRDYSYDLVDFNAWIVVDLTVAVVIASLPVLNTLFTRNFFRDLAASVTGTVRSGTTRTGTSADPKSTVNSSNNQHLGKGIMRKREYDVEESPVLKDDSYPMSFLKDEEDRQSKPDSSHSTHENHAI